MKKKKNYFNNEEVTEAILEYNEYLKQGVDKIELLHPYTTQIQQLVRGVINTHKIYRWWNDTDELVQEGMVAIYASFKRYNPEKGTAFNYLSIVAKQHLKNWTQQRNKKNFLTNEYNDEIHQEMSGGYSESVNLEHLFLDVEVDYDLESTLEAIARIISVDKIFNRRDIIKQLSRNGYDKKDINEVFTQLKLHFGGTDE